MNLSAAATSGDRQFLRPVFVFKKAQEHLENVRSLTHQRPPMYVSSMKSETVPLAMPKDLLSKVRQIAKRTGLSMADTMRQSMKLGLDRLVRELAPQPRITNVDPLPDDVLDRYYSRPERDEAGIERLIKAQAF